MANYPVRDNPYYQQWRGRNFFIDRLAAGLDAPTAPDTGAYGNKVGFLGSLFGSDRNRMNEAAAMRQVDIDQGRKPFEAEDASEKGNITATGEEARKTQAANVPNLIAVDKEKRAADMEREHEQQREFNARQDAELNQKTQDEAMARATQVSENAANRKAAMDIHTTPTAADIFNSTRVRPGGMGTYINPDGSFTSIPNVNYSDTGGKPVHFPSESDMNFLQNPNAIVPTGQQQSGDMDYLRKMQDQVERAQGLIAPPKAPTGISY